MGGAGELAVPVNVVADAQRLAFWCVDQRNVAELHLVSARTAL
jgi:hypothetical protein